MEAPPASDLPTVRQQWIAVAVFSGLMMLCLGLEYWDYPTEVEQGKKTPYDILAMILHSIGCALWISMDRKRRGLEVGKWRTAAVFFGPAVICIYLIVEYKGRALYLLPIVVAIYLSVALVPYVAVLALERFGT